MAVIADWRSNVHSTTNDIGWSYYMPTVFDIKPRAKNEVANRYDYRDPVNDISKARVSNQARVWSLGPEHLAALVERFKAAARAKSDAKTDCPGARGLTEVYLNRLDNLVACVKEQAARCVGK
jgi:hypothetical protein